MKKIVQNLLTIISIVAGVVAVLSFLYQIKSNNPELEILEINNENLTNLPTVRNLKSDFYYKDSLITNLWKLNVTIKNTGTETIIGKGTNKNIITDHLSFKINEGFKLIDLNITNNDFPYSIKKIKNDVFFSFVQWRNEEKINITVYAEQISKEKGELEIILNEREIIDGVINYRKLNQVNENESRRIVDFFPEPFPTILFWVGVIFYGIIILLIPYGLYTEVIKHISFKKWTKNYGMQFTNGIKDLYKKGEIEELYSIELTPYEVWLKLGIPYADKPSNSIWSLILFVCTIFVLVAIPIIWMIKI